MTRICNKLMEKAGREGGGDWEATRNSWGQGWMMERGLFFTLTIFFRESSHPGFSIWVSPPAKFLPQIESLYLQNSKILNYLNVRESLFDRSR